MTIETLEINQLIPYARNSRTHSEAQIAQIAGSIKEFGFTNPVLIDAENTIIAGHGRVMAAHKLKLEKIPCIRLSHLTESQRKAYVIADNKLALNAGWDDEMLGLEIEDLSSLNFDMDLLGFDQNELADLLSQDIEDKMDKNDNEGVDIKSTFEIIVECDDEDHQRMVYNILTEKEIKCRLATF